ncbi:MAG TPA: hypothetical protein VKT82_08660 [Ktedonobacterales bacterium]|nr:hypothetical protein [Ktedonobacterales bacterium]
MNRERLAALMQVHQEALCAHPEDRTPHEAILSILRGLERSEITLRQALKLLSVQALRLDDPPAHQALYRQAAVALLQMEHEE